MCLGCGGCVGGFGGVGWVFECVGVWFELVDC